ncbi:MAG: dihydroorotate dehydrogenase electron transfer subunit [Syntrophobacterales bacterium]|nr:dihydroorotate dehydrogenase electron transfer subunit [Syntrophobacterales bacterium]
MRKYLERAKIIRNLPLASSIYHLELYSPKIANEARAGQFVMLRVTEDFIPLLRRPFSLFRIRKEEGILEIAYKIVGKGTGMLSKKPEGEYVDLLGPLGNGFRLPPPGTRDVWVLAGGIGIAALRPLIESIKGAMPEVNLTLYYGVKSSSELFSIDDFSEMCDGLRCSTDDGSFGFCGNVLGCVIHDWETLGTIPSYLYACGPTVMLRHVAQWVIDHSIPSQFSLESLMGCGVGACLGCAVPKKSDGEPSYVHVCFEGPIFSPDIIQWEKLL